MASLGNDIGANDTTVFIPGGLSIYSYPAQFAVDSEDVLVTGGTSPTYSVSRGQNGTAKATHSSGTTVVAGWASDVDTTPTLAQVVAQGSAANAAITSVTDPTGAQDAATKHYVDNSPTLKSRTVLGAGTGTYTVPAGITAILMRLVGPGSGGGGCPNPGASHGAASGGGGAGGYGEKVYSIAKGNLTAGQSFTYTVGAGGAGGIGNNNGAAGSADTVFDSGGSPVTAKRGATFHFTTPGGGPGAASTNTIATSTNTVGYGGVGATAGTGGDVNMGGASGQSGIAFANGGWAGNGADGPWGGGGLGQNGNGSGGNQTGYDAIAPGAGGGGILVFGNDQAYTGGKGADGIIIIDEYA